MRHDSLGCTLAILRRRGETPLDQINRRLTEFHNRAGAAMSQVLHARALAILLGADSPNADQEHLCRHFSSIAVSFSSLEEAVRATGAQIDDCAGVRSLFEAGAADSALASAALEIAEWHAKGLAPAGFAGPCYPEQAVAIADAPPLLFFEGPCERASRPGVAIVGTRTATSQGLRAAHRAAQVIADSGLVVYSGLAAGIDAAAHRGALEAGGMTVAVMGTPISRRYPKENAPLADRIVASGGALVSEFLPGRATRPWDFLRRNKTMSALASATLVIEAGPTSGAKSQAIAALTHGRPVFLPSSLVAQHQWAHDAVHLGVQGVRAIEVSSAEDVADAWATDHRDASALAI